MPRRSVKALTRPVPRAQETAAECCAACKKHTKLQDQPGRRLVPRRALRRAPLTRPSAPSFRRLQLLGVVPRGAVLVARHLEPHAQRVLAQSAGGPLCAGGEPARRVSARVPRGAQNGAGQDALDGRRAAQPRRTRHRRAGVRQTHHERMMIVLSADTTQITRHPAPRSARKSAKAAAGRGGQRRTVATHCASRNRAQPTEIRSHA